MCGRSACRQCKETYEKASTYQKDGKYVKTRWHDVPNGGLEFHPSSNICPTEVTPVILPGSEVEDLPPETDRVLLPMVWGLIPPWHKGGYKSHGLSTHNCRLEGVSTSKLYGPLFKQRMRCVVVCDGFYEWQTAGKTKQPHFVFAHQPKNCEVSDAASWEGGRWSEGEGWSGPALLYLAGLYHVWTSPDGEEVYNYSVITREADESFSKIHHRIPLILSSDHLVKTWLDVSVSSSEAVGAVREEGRPPAWYPVSTLVNSSSNKSPDCNKPLPTTPKRNALTAWLQKTPPAKRTKDEDSVKIRTEVKKESAE